MLAWVLCASAEVAAQSDTTAADAVSGATLRFAGATRMSDLLPLAAPWSVSTVDGFTWQTASPSGGLSTPSRALVMVDGRRVEADLFGRLDLDRLGIPVEGVERVDFLDLPRLEAGRITSEGIVHIRTVEPQPGTSAHAWYAAGTEIGDPGPFAFTPAGGENVDRLGHDLSFGAAHRSEGWFASGSLTSSERIPTDPAIAARYRAALGPVPRLAATSISLDAGARAGATKHRFTVRHSDDDGVLLLTPLGAEVGIADRVSQVGLSGEVSAGGGRGMSWDFAHTDSRTSPRGLTGRAAIDWEMRATEARLELSRPGRRLPTAGIRFRRMSAEATSPISHPTISVATAYAELSPAPSMPVVGAALTAGDGDLGLAASLARTWSLAGGSTVEGVVGYERRSRAEDTDIWAWTERGYRLFAEAGADFDVIGARHGPERASGDLRWTVRRGTDFRIATRGFFRRERRLSVERSNPVMLVHGVGGELAGGTVGLEWQAVRRLVVRGSYWFGAPVGGDSLYRDARAVVPRHGARLSSEWVPVPGLELWLSAFWRSASRRVGVESPRLGAALTVDAAAAKRFWHGRLRLQAAVRNLLGAELKFHPAGATFDPTVLVRIEGRLP